MMFKCLTNYEIMRMFITYFVVMMSKYKLSKCIGLNSKFWHKKDLCILWNFNKGPAHANKKLYRLITLGKVDYGNIKYQSRLFINSDISFRFIFIKIN